MDETPPQQPESPWKFTSNGTSPAPAPADPQVSGAPSGDENTIEWTASEFIAHRKTFGWYFAFGTVIALVAGLAYILTHDAASTGVVVFVFVMMGIIAGRQPRVLPYRVDRSGVTVGQKMYPYSALKSFFVTNEGAFSSITLLPATRLMPYISIFYDPQDESKILAALGRRLPMEQTKFDAFDRFMQRIRF